MYVNKFKEQKMKSFLEFVKINGYIISEELHTNLQTILDTDEDPEKREKRIQQNPYNTIATDPHALKLNRFVKEAKRLLKNGEETGLESDKPKKGSSRAVFFSKGLMKICLDTCKIELREIISLRILMECFRKIIMENLQLIRMEFLLRF